MSDYEIHPVFGRQVPSVVKNGTYYPIMIRLNEGLVAKLQSEKGQALLARVNVAAKELGDFLND